MSKDFSLLDLPQLITTGRVRSGTLHVRPKLSFIPADTPQTSLFYDPESPFVLMGTEEPTQKPKAKTLKPKRMNKLEELGASTSTAEISTGSAASATLENNEDLVVLEVLNDLLLLAKF